MFHQCLIIYWMLMLNNLLNCLLTAQVVFGTVYKLCSSRVTAQNGVQNWTSVRKDGGLQIMYFWTMDRYVQVWCICLYTTVWKVYCGIISTAIFKNSFYCTLFSKKEASIPSAKSQCVQFYSGHKHQILPDQPTGSMAAEPLTDGHLCCVKSTKFTHTDSSNCSIVSSLWVCVFVCMQFGIRIQGFFVAVVKPCGDFLLIYCKNTCSCLFGSYFDVMNRDGQ